MSPAGRARKSRAGTFSDCITLGIMNAQFAAVAEEEEEEDFAGMSITGQSSSKSSSSSQYHYHQGQKIDLSPLR